MTFTKLGIALLATIGCISCSNSKKVDDTTATDIISTIADCGYEYDSYVTPAGRTVNIIFVKHGSLIINIDRTLLYIDPVSMFGHDLSLLPKADMVLVTHEHHDHFDPRAIAMISTDSTLFIASDKVVELNNGGGKALNPGESIHIEKADFSITATAAYNITPEHLQFHPRERKDIGFIFNIDGLRIYVAGDTEDIPEMDCMEHIDIAFLPVNQPYTMTAEQAIRAVDMIKPAVVYPYHYGDTDLTPIVDHFTDSATTVCVRQMQ